MLAIVCPGQGSQSPGFLSPWLELDGVRAQLDALSEAAGVDLHTHGTTSDADTIRDTAVAQPLIVAAGLITAAQLQVDADVLAGHSVGEFTAAALAGLFGDTDALRLVGVRGRAMAEAATVTATGMSAVIGGDPDAVLAAIEEAGLIAANVNGAGQVVAAGTMGQLSAFAAAPPAKVRVMPLQVAGAFHTEHMAPAITVLGQAAGALIPAEPTCPLLSNVDGQQVCDGRQALDRLVSQVANPVRWDLCMAAMLDLGVTGVIELAPAGTLVGLAKRAMKGVAAVAVKTPDDLAAARALADLL